MLTQNPTSLGRGLTRFEYRNPNSSREKWQELQRSFVWLDPRLLVSIPPISDQVLFFLTLVCFNFRNRTRFVWKRAIARWFTARSHSCYCLSDSLAVESEKCEEVSVKTKFGTVIAFLLCFVNKGRNFLSGYGPKILELTHIAWWVWGKICGNGC